MANDLVKSDKLTSQSAVSFGNKAKISHNLTRNDEEKAVSWLIGWKYFTK